MNVMDDPFILFFNLSTFYVLSTTFRYENFVNNKYNPVTQVIFSPQTKAPLNMMMLGCMSPTSTPVIMPRRPPRKKCAVKKT